MFDDFDLPGLDDLVDLLDSLWDALDLDVDVLADIDEPVLPMWADGGPAIDLAGTDAFWVGMDGPPLDPAGFAGEFGNMQFHNPFSPAGGIVDGPADGPAGGSMIEDGSYDDFLVRTSLNTGIPLGDLPN